MKFYGQEGNKWSSTLFPTKEEKLGIGLQIKDRFKDSCPNGALVVAAYGPDGGFLCQSGRQPQVHTSL